MRAANQAIGRVIRHERDYGMVFLLEFRYSSDFISYLPSWIRENIAVVRQASELYRHISDFFKDKKAEFDENAIENDGLKPLNYFNFDYEAELQEEEDNRTIALSEYEFDIEELEELRASRFKPGSGDAITEILESNCSEETDLDDDLNLSEISEEFRKARMSDQISERIEQKNYKRLKLTPNCDDSFSDCSEIDRYFLEKEAEELDQLFLQAANRNSNSHHASQQQMIILPNFKNN